MPDPTLAQKESFLRLIRRAVAEHEGMLGAVLPEQHLTPGTGLGAPGGPDGPPEIFPTGYNAGTGQTTTAFIFDMSAFDSGDELT